MNQTPRPRRLHWQRPISRRTVSRRTVSQRPVSQRPVSQRPVSQRPVSQRPVSQRPVSQCPVSQWLHLLGSVAAIGLLITAWGCGSAAAKRTPTTPATVRPGLTEPTDPDEAAYAEAWRAFSATDYAEAVARLDPLSCSPTSVPAQPLPSVFAEDSRYVMRQAFHRLGWAKIEPLLRANKLRCGRDVLASWASRLPPHGAHGQEAIAAFAALAAHAPTDLLAPIWLQRAMLVAESAYLDGADRTASGDVQAAAYLRVIGRWQDAVIAATEPTAAWTRAHAKNPKALRHVMGARRDALRVRAHLLRLIAKTLPKATTSADRAAALLRAADATARYITVEPIWGARCALADGTIAPDAKTLASAGTDALGAGCGKERGLRQDAAYFLVEVRARHLRQLGAAGRLDKRFGALAWHHKGGEENIALALARAKVAADPAVHAWLADAGRFLDETEGADDKFVRALRAHASVAAALLHIALGDAAVARAALERARAIPGGKKRDALITQIQKVLK